MRAIHPKAGLSDRFRTADRRTLFVLPAAFFPLLLFISPYLAAVPASPEPAELSQADGSRVKVFLKGDEYYHWNEDAKGYTILKDTATKDWVYAEKDPATLPWKTLKVDVVLECTGRFTKDDAAAVHFYWPGG